MSWKRLETSIALGGLDSAGVVRLLLEQQASVASLALAESDRIARAVEAIEDRLRNGGRLVFVGSGLSGRLAGIVAGGLSKNYSIDAAHVITRDCAIDAEGDADEQAIARVKAVVRPDDAVVGVSASGENEFTVAAMRAANLAGALTICVVTVPGALIARECDIPVVVDTGAEVVMGETGLRSATARLMVLDAIAVGVAIRLGRVWSNLPVEREIDASNAWRVVQAGTGCSPIDARLALGSTSGRVKDAIAMLRLGVSAEDARARLEACGDDLSRVVGKIS